jgi:hypothetical protein
MFRCEEIERPLRNILTAVIGARDIAHVAAVRACQIDVRWATRGADRGAVADAG